MTKTSTDLVDRYLQAVGFWLPRSQKQDILAEISEDLRSQIEDRETELGRTLTESEVAEILKQRGRPIFVAGQFLPQRSLIGPALYPIYIFVLKIVALCYLIPWLATWFGILIFHRAEATANLSRDWHTLPTLWTVVFTQFGIVTLIFAAIDRASAKGTCMNDWDPRKLPKVKVETPTKRRVNAVACLVFAVLGLVWVLAIPDNPFLILGPAAAFLTGAPIWHSVYWPLVALAVATIFEHAFVLAWPHLTWFPPTFRIATTLLSAWIVGVLLRTQTYLLPADQKFAQVAGIVNVCILISVGIWGICLVVQLVYYTWWAFREIRRALQTATLHPA
ncbi:MAG: hypothetical protein JOZ83_16265 [Silvibacterium sp.]|nr:hypothetical protein [Silvibacterium sp.]